MYSVTKTESAFLTGWRAISAVAVAGLLVSGVSEGQVASNDALADIGDISERLYQVRNTFREKGTLAERMRTSISLQYCHLHEGGLKASAGYDLDSKAKIQQGAGKDVSAQGASGAYNIKPSTIVGLETAGKLTGRTSFCVNLHELGDGWAEVDPTERVSAFEDDYLYYDETGASPDPAPQRRSIQTGGTRADVSSIADITPVDVLNTLVAGYVGMGLDPADVDQVRALLMGPNVVGIMNDMGSAIGGIASGTNPVELPLAAFNAIDEIVDTLPFLDPLTSPFEALASIDSGDNICHPVPGIDLSDACDLSEAIVDIATNNDNDARNIASFPGHVQSLAEKTAGWDALASSTLSKVRSLKNVMSHPQSHIAVMHEKANDAFGVYMAWKNQALQQRGYLSEFIDLFEAYDQNFCKDFKNEKVIPIIENGWARAYCAVDYAINPCAQNPAPRVQLQCEYRSQDLGTIAGGTFDFVRQQYEEVKDEVETIIVRFSPF